MGYVSSLSLYPIDIFRNYEKICRVCAPVAVVHGTADAVVPCACGRALAALAPKRYTPYWLEGFGHNNMPYEAVIAYLNAFLVALSFPVPAPKPPRDWHSIGGSLDEHLDARHARESHFCFPGLCGSGDTAHLTN